MMNFSLPTLPVGSSPNVSSAVHESTLANSDSGGAANAPGRNARAPTGALAGLSNKPTAFGKQGRQIRVGPKVKLSANTRNAIDAAKDRGAELSHAPDPSGQTDPRPSRADGGNVVQSARADSANTLQESMELARINMQTNSMLAQIQNMTQLNMSLNQLSEQLGKNAKALTQG